MPPSRRRPPATPPPGRRPKVAGLRHHEEPKHSATAPADDTPTQVIKPVPDEQPGSEPAAKATPRHARTVETTPGAEESLAARRARRARARTEPEPEPSLAAEETPEPPVDSHRGVPPWLTSAGGRTRRVSDVTKLIVLACAAVILAAFGVFAGLQWHATASDPTTENTAYVDVATTSQVKGEVVDAIQKILSYTYANPKQTQQDAHKVLTGVALCQYDALFKNVIAQAPAQKITVTTSIDQQNSGVEQLQGNQARLLLLVNQESTRGSNGQKVTSQAVLEVGAVAQGGSWKVDNLSTFGTGQNPTNCK